MIEWFKRIWNRKAIALASTTARNAVVQAEMDARQLELHEQRVEFDERVREQTHQHNQMQEAGEERLRFAKRTYPDPPPPPELTHHHHAYAYNNGGYGGAVGGAAMQIGGAAGGAGGAVRIYPPDHIHNFPQFRIDGED